MKCPEGYDKDVWHNLPDNVKEELLIGAIASSSNSTSSHGSPAAQAPVSPQPKQKTLHGFLNGCALP